MLREIITGRKHISTVGQFIDALINDHVESTRNSEIDKETEQSVSWAKVVKGGISRHAKHAHKK